MGTPPSNTSNSTELRTAVQFRESPPFLTKPLFPVYSFVIHFILYDPTLPWINRHHLTGRYGSSPIKSAVVNHPELQQDRPQDEDLFVALFFHEGAFSQRVA